jgi:hypothetical protein
MRSTTSFSVVAACTLLLHHARAIVITGISAGVNNITGERPFRRDINELYMSGPAWDLFILSLSAFQQMNQDDPLSYYQISGKARDCSLEKTGS